MSIEGRKLRKTDNDDCGCGPAGRDTGHQYRIQDNIQNHIDNLYAEEREHTFKTIDQRVQQGRMSPDVARFLKKNS